MEKKTVITNSLNEKNVLDKHDIFLYKCEEKKYVGGHVEITFSRDDNLPYIKELRELEKEYGDFKIPPLVWLFILPAISFSFFTAFLILFIIQRQSFDFILFFWVLLVPGLAFLLLSFVSMFIRGKKIEAMFASKKKKDAEYRAKVEELK